MMRWLLKVRQPGGGISVLDHSEDKQQMENAAVVWNHAYQTDTAYVEENRSHANGSTHSSEPEPSDAE
jgi:hypothetical protein